ncbi:hypothetical protein ACH5RR_034201 [Cinchona calisaya]|uniref:Uncharacterized protein n=1 Tax=Cinchona calisaya TaxID=153742 RepID=A0ABD2YDT5_9GENT
MVGLPGWPMGSSYRLVRGQPLPCLPATSTTNEPKLQDKKRSRKDALTDVVKDVVNIIRLFFERKKMKEEMQPPIVIEIHEEISKIAGLTELEVYQAVRKMMLGHPKEFNLLKKLPYEKKRGWVRFILES